MITRLKLKRGQKGTNGLLAQYGDAFFCVRNRYDKARRKRMKTAELIIEESKWHPPARMSNDSDLVPVLIGYADRAMRETVRTARGRWDPQRRLWMILCGNVRGTLRGKHIVLDAFPGTTKT